MAGAKKRFIVSFKEQRVEPDVAVEVFKVRKKDLCDGIALLASHEEPADEQVLSFADIGAAAVSLTDQQAEELAKDERVAEVVEDFEVFALDGCCDDGEDELGEEWEFEAAYGPAFQQGVRAGYQRALSELYGDPAAGGGSLQAAAPPFPFPPTRRCPPGTRPIVRCRFLCVPTLPPKPPPTQPIPWNIGMVKADEVWSRVTGRGVKVGIIDTGIDEDHPDLTVSGGASFVPGVASWDDDNGHGTHVAGITGARHNPIGVVGVAPDSSLYAIKVLSGAGSGRLSWILAGMAWATQEDMQVVNLSLGSNVGAPDASCVLAYQRAAENLLQNGCIVIAAAGNAGRGATPWVGQPARCPGFMAVAAVDRNQDLASFSSRGPASLCPECGVEISAPGVRVNSTWPGGGYKEISGTSMAAPHVAGGAALLTELRPIWTPAQIRARLKATAADLGAPGNDPEYGAGLLDCHRAVFG